LISGNLDAKKASTSPPNNFRMNNRNHRKIIVIDGQVGYIGGFNIGDDYLGLGLISGNLDAKKASTSPPNDSK
jgi:cardiolipin synthase